MVGPTEGTATAEQTCSAAVAALPHDFGALGRYVLLEMVGYGGMGVVWKAYDPVLDRKIALKLVVPSSVTRGNIVTEAQAMARLQHPNVVTVHDAGVQQAGAFELAYVAMELVTGRNLKQWLAADPQRSAQERLEMFMRAGRGLEAAHAAGLVHRDFKPSNVLLGDDGRVRVSDFGLAVVGAGVETQAPAGGSSTMLSPLAGTPRYMSPEQLHGLPADARCDQFSFCVALYEAIFGAHPFAVEENASIADLRAKVLQTPSPPVRSRLAARLLPAILRGLAVDPTQRFASMSELLAALDAAQSQRGKRLLVAGALTTIVAALAVLGWRSAAAPPRACLRVADALDAAWRPERRQSIAVAFGALGDRGAAVWPRVAPALDDWAARWRTLRIEQCEADRNGARPSPTLTARRDCLDRRLGELAGLIQVLEKPDRTVVNYASNAARSLTPPESCMSALPPVDAKAPPPPIRDGLAQVQTHLDRAAALRLLGKHKPALEEAQAAAGEAAKIDWAPLTAAAQLELGRGQYGVSATNPATDAFYRALWTAEAVRDDGLRFDASRGLFLTSLDASDYPLAARQLETSKAIAQHLPADGTRSTRLAQDEARLALYRGQFKECLRWGEEALRLAEKAAPETRLVVSVMLDLEECHASLEQEDQAMAYLTRALPIAEKVNGHEDAQTASVLNELGKRESELQHHEAALEYFREALAIRERMVGPDNPDCAAMHNNIGNRLRDLKRYDQARSELELAISIWTKAWGPDAPAVGIGSKNLGSVAMDLGHFKEAEAYFRRTVEIYRKKRPAGHPDIADAVQYVGRAVLAQKKPEALGLLEEALAGIEHDGDSTAGQRAEARFWVGRARVELGIRRTGAYALAEAACNELTGPTWRPKLADCRAWLAAHARAARP